jgi:hypothetical protein
MCCISWSESGAFWRKYADDELFKDIVANGYLPKDRADGCGDEYAQVAYAFETLIGPYIDSDLSIRRCHAGQSG